MKINLKQKINFSLILSILLVLSGASSIALYPGKASALALCSDVGPASIGITIAGQRFTSNGSITVAPGSILPFHVDTYAEPSSSNTISFPGPGGSYSYGGPSGRVGGGRDYSTFEINSTQYISVWLSQNCADPAGPDLEAEVTITINVEETPIETCGITSFTADNTSPAYNTGTTLRYSLSGSFPWNITLLNGSVLSSPNSGDSSGGTSSTGNLTSTHIYRLSCGSAISDITVTPQAQPVTTGTIIVQTKDSVGNNVSADWGLDATLDANDFGGVGGGTFTKPAGQYRIIGSPLAGYSGPTYSPSADYVTLSTAGTLTFTLVYTVVPPSCVPDGSCSAPAPACGTVTSGTNNCGTPCSKTGPACPGGSQQATGYLDSADCSAFGGWAWDPDFPNNPIDIHLYDNGVWSFVAHADVFRADLPGNKVHGFGFSTPNAFKTGVNHVINAYAIDLNGDGNPQLIGSPVNINCPIPPPTNLTSSCPGTGTSATLSWTLPQGYSLSYLRVYDNDAAAYAGWIPETWPDNGPSITFPSTPGHNYTWWVHTRMPSGAASTEVYNNFTCVTGTLPVIPASCGTTPTHYTCPSGTYAGNGVNGPTAYTWTCNGLNGGANASCTETKTAGNSCPTGAAAQVTLSASTLNAGQTATVSAPAGFTGGTFVSNNTSVATVSGSTVTAVAPGVAIISGVGWTHTATGSTGCKLSGSGTIASSCPVGETGTTPTCSGAAGICSPGYTGTPPTCVADGGAALTVRRIPIIIEN